MYKPKIFLLGESADTLIALEETEYVTEDVLQGLVERYPDLLPGDQIDPENPRRWLLAAREMGVPGDVTETGRWSLDHLFLDQDGIPTFVECKRSSDTRARREVVAQMLDYAANGVAYWSMERIRQAAAETAQRQGAGLDQKIAALLGSDPAGVDVEQYWKQVEDNLHEHRLRLVFVADRMSKELRRLIEFLNAEMSHVEVLGVEVKQYRRSAAHHGQLALVPRLVGFSESARTTKETATLRQKRQSAADFLGKCTPEAGDFFRAALDYAEQKGYTIYWGTVGFSMRAYFPASGKLGTFMLCYPPNKFQVYLHPDWLPPEAAAAVREKLRQYPFLTGEANYTLTALVTSERLVQIQEIFDLVLAQVEGQIASPRLPSNP